MGDTQVCQRRRVHAVFDGVCGPVHLAPSAAGRPLGVVVRSAGGGAVGSVFLSGIIRAENQADSVLLPVCFLFVGDAAASASDKDLCSRPQIVEFSDLYIGALPDRRGLGTTVFRALQRGAGAFPYHDVAGGDGPAYSRSIYYFCLNFTCCPSRNRHRQFEPAGGAPWGIACGRACFRDRRDGVFGDGVLRIRLRMGSLAHRRAGFL